MKTKKTFFKFEELTSLFDLSPGYSRKIIANLVKQELLIPQKDKRDKRKVKYYLNWGSFRNYLLNEPIDYDDLILRMVGPEHEGKYVAEVDIDLIDTNEGWSPYLSLDDAKKLDDVRDSLRKGDFETASRLARIYTLTPIEV